MIFQTTAWIGPSPADGHAQLVARGVAGALQRQTVEIGIRVGLLLPALVVEELAEIPLPVHEPDAHQRQPHVGAGLEMVAGQNTQPAGEQGQALVQAELHGKIGDGLAGAERKVELDFRVVDPAFEKRPDPLHLGGVAGVAGKLFQARLGDPRKERHGVAAASAHRRGSMRRKSSTASRVQHHHMLPERVSKNERFAGMFG
jgi:hypothetical protein